MYIREAAPFGQRPRGSGSPARCATRQPAYSARLPGLPDSTSSQYGPKLHPSRGRSSRAALADRQRVGVTRVSFLKSAFVGLALIATASASVAEEGAGAGFSVSLEPRGAEQPSFDCARAKSAAALLICADGELARLDAELGAAFQKRKAEISPAERLKFAADQLAWIRARNTRCALDGKGNAAIEALAIAKPCMVKAIRGRIAFLAQAGSALPPGFVLDQSSRMPGNLLSDSDVGFGGAAAQPQSGSARAPDDWFVPDEGAREECDPDAIPTKYDPLKGVTDFSATRSAPGRFCRAQ